MDVSLGPRPRILKRASFLALTLAVVLVPACRDKKAPRVQDVPKATSALPQVTRAPGENETRSSLRTIDIAGRPRNYVLVEPKNFVLSRKYPLVLVFHGDGGDAASFHGLYRFESASGADAFVAYPEGLNRTWDLETKIDNPDVQFAATLVDELASRLPVDKTRVFLTGYSSGGFLSNLIACQKSGLARAIASHAGGAPYRQLLVWSNGYTRCPGQEPVAMMALHGERDMGVTLDSGRFSAEYWAYVNGCRTDEMETTGYDECHAYRGCAPGKPVVFCPIPGLGHWIWDRGAEATWTFFERESR